MMEREQSVGGSGSFLLGVSCGKYCVCRVGSHSEQHTPPPPPPAPPAPPQPPQYGLPSAGEARDKQPLCFSDFQDLSASFRSLYQRVFQQSFSQPDLMGMPGEPGQQSRTVCSYQHSPGSGVNGGGSGGGGGGAHHQQHHQHHHHQAHGHSQAPHHAHHHPHLSPHSAHGPHPAHPGQHSQQPSPLSLHALSGTGMSADWYPNLDWLKESCRIATSYNWSDVDLSPFQGLKESMRQAALNNWSLDGAQMADLCSSINQFFSATGVIPAQTGSLPTAAQAQHPTPQPGSTQQSHGALHPKAGQAQQHSQHISSGNMYMDSRQSISAMMTPPGYPHLPHLAQTGPPTTGLHSQLSQQQQHMLPPPPGHFTMRRLPAADDIQDDFDWDSIV
ncbi:unnamed protein product [Arctogadus glacialis]